MATKLSHILTKSLSVWDISSGSTYFICCKQCVSCAPNCEKFVWRTLMTTISSSLNMSYKHKINKLSTKHFAKRNLSRGYFFICTMYMYVYMCTKWKGKIHIWMELNAYLTIRLVFFGLTWAIGSFELFWWNSIRDHSVLNFTFPTSSQPLHAQSLTRGSQEVLLFFIR